MIGAPVAGGTPAQPLMLMRQPIGLLLVLTTASATPEAFAQTLSIGAVGGFGLTSDYGGTGTTTMRYPRAAFDFLETRTTYTSRHTFIAGPKLELKFTNRLSLEVDALRRPRWKSVEAEYSPPVVIGSEVFSSFSSTSAETDWEIPVLLKYRLPVFSERHFVTPFVEAGPSFRPWLYRGGAARAGVTGGVGLQFRVGCLRIEPTIRYTRWGADERYSYFYTPAKPDQFEFLIGAGAESATLRPTIFGRQLSAGALGGFGLSGDFPEKEGYSSARSKLVGVAFESAVSERLFVEFNALYRPRILSERARATVLTWEFPVLAKYKLGAVGRGSFLELGPSFRASGNTNATSPSPYGITAGVGIERTVQRLRVAPAVRYTRWAADQATQWSPGSTIRNQVDLVVGFLF